MEIIPPDESGLEECEYYQLAYDSLWEAEKARKVIERLIREAEPTE